MSIRVVLVWSFLSVLAITGCPTAPMPDDMDADMDDGPVAEGVSASLGEPMPSATAEQLETFNRGKEVFQKRFDLADGLGPAFNVTFCGACHERPVVGGSSGLYRSFFLAGRLTENGFFANSESAGMAGGVLRVYSYGGDRPVRPEVPADTTIFAQRNAIPMFGVGLLALISDDEILSRVDVNDDDGDGISGRANFDQSFVGRFGRKSQTVSLEGFVRGPIFNHLGVTTDPLTDEQRARLPVDSSLAATLDSLLSGKTVDSGMGPNLQAAAPEGPNFDEDGVPDPEMSSEMLFDLISFVMLLAAPELEKPTEQSNRGRLLFHDAKCSACHVPRLQSPNGPLPVYSDLLLHDMGEALADGIEQNFATGSEFRTQPLWGIAAVGPYLHDGRAETIHAAIMAHGGEAQASREVYAGFIAEQQDDVLEFLLSLGGRAQFSTGLLSPDELIPAVGEYGGPLRELSTDEQDRFLRGRELFDRDFGFDSGAGALVGADLGPRLNGDSCRACHFDPVIGGAGPRDVNVMRHGTISADGIFAAPPDTPNTILHKEIAIGFELPVPADSINVLEHRQTPATFGLGLVDAISEETIQSNADPNDEDGDGISGRAHVLADGRIGRLGWKAQVPSVAEFVRDAMAAEIGLTLERQEGLSFGIEEDDDGITDPELSRTEAEDLAFFISMLAAPPRQPGDDAAMVEQGQRLFDSIGCTKCHIMTLPSSLGDVPLLSDLLLHDILTEGSPGIEDGDASMTEFRTAPLWGLSQTAPYLHTGAADTVEDAIRMHAGEASSVRDAFLDASESDQQAILAWLGSL